MTRNTLSNVFIADHIHDDDIHNDEIENNNEIEYEESDNEEESDISEELLEIETSPFTDEDGEIIRGNNKWNDYIINNLDYHYPLLNQKTSEFICDLLWTFNEDEDEDENEDDNNYNIDFSYIKAKNEQKYIKLSTELKYYESHDNNMSTDEINNIKQAFIYIINNGVFNIKLKDTDISFLTRGFYFDYICPYRICAINEYTINTIDFYYPINRNIDNEILKDCILDLKEYLLNL